jgi:ribonuclease Z
MKIRVIGCGEAFDSGPGNNSFLLSAPATEHSPSTQLLIDCGYQIPERLWHQGLHTSLDGLYLTHTHADHSFGVVPLLTRFWEEKRSQAFTIIGHNGVKNYVEKLMELGYPRMLGKLPYPLHFISVSPAAAIEWNGINVTTAQSEHGIKNLSVRFEHDSKSCAFSGDGGITPATRALYDGVDLLFHELFATRRNVPGHTNLVSLSALERELELARIVVSHHGRRYKDAVVRAIDSSNKRSKHATWISAKPDQEFVV